MRGAFRALVAGTMAAFGIGSILRGLYRNNGTPPDVWGRSRACARMVARNRAVAAGRRRG